MNFLKDIRISTGVKLVFILITTVIAFILLIVTLNTIETSNAFSKMQHISQTRKNIQKIIMSLDTARGDINYVNFNFAISPEKLAQKIASIPSDIDKSKKHADLLFNLPGNQKITQIHSMILNSPMKIWLPLILQTWS